MDRSTEARDKRLKRLLVSMRSMDSSRNQGLPPGGGGRRHVRPRSPSCEEPEHQSRQRGQRRQGDASTDEIIRFVRGYQLERESTWLRLQKRAPLPGIGQATHSMQGSSRHQERRPSLADGDEDDEDEDLLDNEVSAIERGPVDASRHQFRVIDNRFAPSFKVGPGAKRRDRNFKANASYGPPASYHRQTTDVHRSDNYSHGGGNFSPKVHTRKGWGRTLKHLPPIPSEELAERPSAPSPSFTPPGEDEELDSSGEPVDFIDAP